ncbi:MAG: VOC family protein [Chitinophagales bacterium]
MIKQIWINLPVKNINKSRDFFVQLGFTLNTQYGNSENGASLFVGEKNVVVMLFPETIFRGFTSNEITDPKKGTEVLFSIDAESREEVDELARKVVAAGGSVYNEPGDNQGWMYGFGFMDIDGHRWNVLYMDFSKMPK